MRIQVALYISVHIVLQAFGEYSNRSVVVEHVAALECTLDQLVDVLLDAETMLSRSAYGVVGLVDHFRRRLPT